MKVIFNSDSNLNSFLKENTFKEFKEATFQDEPKYVCDFHNIEVLRSTNKENGKPILLLSDTMVTLDVRVVEFDSIIEMFHYIDSISIWRFEFKICDQ